jgi:capsular polysaccharide export protein
MSAMIACRPGAEREPLVGKWMPSKGAKVIIEERAIRRIPDIRGFFPPDVAISRMPLSLSKADVVVGWGLRPSGLRARQVAAKHGLGAITLEDGFLRSTGLGVHGARPLSLVTDDLGVHLDASGPSRLETILQSSGWETSGLLTRTRAAIGEMRRLRMSKYNPPRRRSVCPSGLPRRRFVMIVDQTEGDTSVAGGLAGPHAFRAMLRAAQRENPHRQILVRAHPDVLAGRRQGYLLSSAREAGLDVMEPNIDPWDALDACESVYTVTSQLGFEALIAGRNVRCFGMPFYAGWGATHDELLCDRRTRQRDLNELFAAAYLLYARYVDPFTGKASTFEQTLDTLNVWRRAAELGRSACVGVSRWKRHSVARALSLGGADVTFHTSAAAAISKTRAVGGQVVVWASREPPSLAALAQQHGVTVARLEDGFLRSVGLGAALTPGLSYVLDGRGVHYDPAAPSELEALIEGGNFPEPILNRARLLIEHLIASRVTKYNLGGSLPERECWPSGTKRILVAGQVETDASLLLGSLTMRRNADLLATVRAENPGAFLVWKAHPDVIAGLRPGAVSSQLVKRLANLDASAVDTASLLEVVDEVHVMTSALGFEALLRGRRVVVHGAPFYAGWGLTEDRQPIERRTRRATVEELAAAALLAYPLYLDPKTGLPCSPEVALARLQEARLWKPGLMTRARVLYGRLRQMVGRVGPAMLFPGTR